jgi:hypothetical protein
MAKRPLSFLQEFASVQEEQGKSAGENEESEGSAGDDAGGEADDEQTEGENNWFPRMKTRELLWLGPIRHVIVQKRKLMIFHFPSFFE